MALMDRLTIKIEPDRLTFAYGGETIGGPDPAHVDPDQRAEDIVREFSQHGVDASAELESIAQAVRDYRSSRP